MHFNSMFPEFQYIEPGNLLDRFIVNTPFIRRIQIQAMGYFFISEAVVPEDAVDLVDSVDVFN
jgi:hypothetical protein